MSNSNNSLSQDDVKKVAELAMLNISDSEVETYTPQLASILNLAAEMDSFDVDGFEPTHHPHGIVNVYRDDKIEDIGVTEAVLEQAPDSEANQFKVPPALGEEL